MTKLDLSKVPTDATSEKSTFRGAYMVKNYGFVKIFSTDVRCPMHPFRYMWLRHCTYIKT
jgi:hypothetical protein